MHDGLPLPVPPVRYTRPDTYVFLTNTSLLYDVAQSPSITNLVGEDVRIFHRTPEKAEIGGRQNVGDFDEWFEDEDFLTETDYDPPG